MGSVSVQNHWNSAARAPEEGAHQCENFETSQVSQNVDDVLCPDCGVTLQCSLHDPHLALPARLVAGGAKRRHHSGVDLEQSCREGAHNRRVTDPHFADAKDRRTGAILGFSRRDTDFDGGNTGVARHGGLTRDVACPAPQALLAKGNVGLGGLVCGHPLPEPDVHHPQSRRQLTGEDADGRLPLEHRRDDLPSQVGRVTADGVLSNPVVARENENSFAAGWYHAPVNRRDPQP